MVLHHLADRLSCREPYSEWLQKCTGKRYRYVRKIKLHGELAEFLGQDEFEAVVKTAEAVKFLITNFPKLEAYMSNRYYQVLVGGNELEKEQIHDPVGKSKHMSYLL